MSDLLTIETLNDIQVVDSRLVAEALGIQHPNLMQTIKRYQVELEEFNHLVFETGVGQRKQGGGKAQKFCYLTEDQAIFVGTLSRNTAKVVAFKVSLVKSFAQARKALESTAPKTNTELLLLYAQQMVAFEQKQREQEERLNAIEKEKALAKEELVAISEKPTQALFADTRKALDNLIKAYAVANDINPQNVYRTLYLNFSQVTGKQVYQNARKADKTPIAWIESRGLITTAYDLAQQLFGNTSQGQKPVQIKPARRHRRKRKPKPKK